MQLRAACDQCQPVLYLQGPFSRCIGGKKSDNNSSDLANRIFLLWVVVSLWAVTSAAQTCAWPPSPLHAFPVDSTFGRIEIRVVVHVIWREGVENISDAQIQSQIEALNRDFSGTNTDRQQVTQPVFRQLMADTEIVFRLADRNPQGQPSSGIIRRQTAVAAIATAYAGDGRRRVCYEELGGSDAWPSECYLNIWVAAFPAGLAGQASQPGQSLPAEDGVFIAPSRFGQTGTVTPPYHLGRTATHEIGHYFNLLHLWGEGITASCAGDDGVGDTPCQSLSYLEMCPQGAGFTCGTPDMTQNFMSLSEDACLLFFTQGQKMRMRQAIAQWRPGFLPDSDCLVSYIHETNHTADDPLTGCQLRAQSLRLVLALQQPWEVRLWAIHGQLAGDWEGNGSVDEYHPLPRLKPGLYVLQLKTGGNIYTKKLIFVE